MKTPSQGTSTKNEGFARYTPSLHIIESIFTPKQNLRNKQEEANMEGVLQKCMDKSDSFREAIPFHTCWETHR